MYEVSQIYYQQGLNKGDVMGLTTETLKMARIAGLDYATAADYMTTAIRGFKLEMSILGRFLTILAIKKVRTIPIMQQIITPMQNMTAKAFINFCFNCFGLT